MQDHEIRCEMPIKDKALTIEVVPLLVIAQRELTVPQPYVQEQNYP
jgi:hypothetical protein